MPPTDLPLQDARNANDLLPYEEYPNELPKREAKPSCFSQILHKRKLQIFAGLIVLISLAAGAVAVGIHAGRSLQEQDLPASTEQPAVTIISTTYSNEAGLTTWTMTTRSCPSTLKTQWRPPGITGDMYPSLECIGPGCECVPQPTLFRNPAWVTTTLTLPMSSKV